MKKSLSKIVMVTLLTTTLSLSNFNLVHAIEKAPEIVVPTENIKLTIIEHDNTIFEDNINLPESCVVTDSNNTTSTFSGYKAICALQQAIENNQIDSFQVTDWGGELGFSLDSLNSIANASDWSESWILKKNNNDADKGISNLSLTNNDNLTLVYDSWPQGLLDIYSPTTTMYVGDTINIESLIWNEGSFVTNTEAVTFYVNNEKIESDNGILEFKPESAGNYEIYVDSSSAVVSKKINVEVLEKPEELSQTEKTATTHLLIRYQNQVILDKGVNLPTESIYNYHKQGESENLTTSTDKITLLGLLSSIDDAEDSFSLSNVEYYESSFGNGFYVKCIDVILSDNTTKQACDNWQYVVDGQYPLTGMDQYELSNDGQNIYLYFGDRYQITSNKNEYSKDEPIIANLYEFDYVNGIYASSTSLSEQLDIYQSNEDYTNTVFASSTLDDNSQVIFSNPGTEGTYNVGLKNQSEYGNYYWPYITINITSTTLTTDNNETTPSGSSGGGSSYTPDNFVDKAFTFLNSKIENGSFFDSPLYTDWAAIAYGSSSNNSSQKTSITNYLINNPLSESSLITDYERRAMALMALNQSPYDSSSVNYIEKIVASFDGEQIGEDSLYNDDIFGIITLINAGYTYDDEIVKKSTEFLISKQNNITGSFGDIDMTAAAIQALTSLNSTDENITTAIESAKNYLKSKQDENASFNSSNLFSTTWSMQAITALGEEENNWSKNGTTPSDYLKSKQQTDGGISSIKENTEQTRVWLTSYSIPAYLHKTWDNILQNFSKQILNSDNTNTNSNNTSNDTTTSTEKMTTSTRKIIELEDNETTTSTTEIEILPVDLELLETTTTLKNNVVATKETIVLPTPTTYVAQKNNIEEIRGEKIEEEPKEKILKEDIGAVQNDEKVELPAESQNEGMPTNKKIAIGLGSIALLYGLFILFKLFA